ncbi:MAG: PQQ-binding-like beta-propeller repeat protein [Planctomycetales bacterium]|nr:PQQ-binding-like beta-propeller repeat protein [Planctomycetales bacterium]
MRLSVSIRYFVRLAAFPIITLAALLVASASAGQEAEDGPRTWTDSTGKYKMVAEFVRMTDAGVLLRREDNSEVTVPLSKLSRADQTVLRQLIQQRRRASENQPSADATSKSKSTGDWPTWRGANRDGVCQETGLLSEWPEDGPRQVWQVSGLGTGYSSVAIADGVIYTMGRQDGVESLIALKTEDGSELWRTEVGRANREKGPNCSPTVSDGRVYALSFEGDLLCADAKTGRELWRKSFAREFGGRMMSGWRFSESQLVAGDRLICTPGGQQAMMAELDKATGRVIWTTPMPNGGSRGGDGAGYSSIVISNAAGVKQYVQLVGRGVIGVAANDGRLLWRYEAIANGTANIPTPIVVDNFVFCSTGYGDGGTALLELSGGPRGVNMREVYYKSSNETQNHHGGMIRIGDYVYMGHGHNNGFPLCVEWKTGRDVWRPGRGPGSGSAAILCADGHFYFRYENGKMALIEATPDEYRLKSTFKIPSGNGPSWPHPVIADGRLYLRDQEVLLCYDVRP